jgi:hypothetical protein
MPDVPGSGPKIAEVTSESLLEYFRPRRFPIGSLDTDRQWFAAIKLSVDRTNLDRIM